MYVPDAIHRIAALALVAVLAACDGMVTGERVDEWPLTEQADGNFEPVRLALTPDMNPVAINLKGETIAKAGEGGRWNSYVANLVHAGEPIASSRFDINNPGTQDQDQGGPFLRTLFFVTVPEAGEYELTVRANRPREITVQALRLEVRRNTQPAGR